ncbi:hypothetical protein EKO04_010217 [Ascochyta lentis]|uniref:Uncharacterized protein n=1 Tax=Ascochyta lentis TaxID=205686 RepID=A0A8H7IUX6_9PLEO|nr:hypothetical protein EKO04_010217 [Ascochyta lentis]
MASHAKLRFAEDKKRMSIGYTHPDDDGERQEIWITFVMTASGAKAHTYSSKDGEGTNHKMSHKDSPPDLQTLPLEDDEIG